MNLCCLFLVKIVAIYGLLVCKTFGLKIGLCKFFDKSQVWTVASDNNVVMEDVKVPSMHCVIYKKIYILL